ncbi:hypothetical protein CERZMDRAFT_111123 [Cercospora zeae-maydis SCOH1-5]|uniref:Uncharacterized protein n=1 Tax=Cercospora zeae-maydis SCOH1-5 TaxID=717836 RepID=A0A6A6FIX6_9PEZI|nr:hypothetical protein CERZMDRAFT_111123 [Cercospora zeae-maydis SCOH1-5]
MKRVHVTRCFYRPVPRSRLFPSRLIHSADSTYRPSGYPRWQSSDSKPIKASILGSSRCLLPGHLSAVLDGVANAARKGAEELMPLRNCLQRQFQCRSPSLWLATFKQDLGEEGTLLQLAKVTLGVAILRARSRLKQEASTNEIGFVWQMLYDALTATGEDTESFRLSRSAQGFIAIPLCSHVKNGRIEELFRLHVWLPDGQRGTSGFSVHSHQPHAQSWILAGTSVDHSKEVASAYKTHQSFSKVINTHRYMHPELVRSTTHTANMSYTIGPGEFHRTEVARDRLHATLFFFDSSRGFVDDAPVLGPAHQESSVQVREVEAHSPASLAKAVHALRCWERFMQQSVENEQKTDSEASLRALTKALRVCHESPILSKVPYYRSKVLIDLSRVHRSMGVYQKAAELAKRVMSEEPATGVLHLQASNELGIISRHLDDLQISKDLFQEQHGHAIKACDETERCRSTLNLGISNYLLFKSNENSKLLGLAEDQLRESVRLARGLGKHMKGGNLTDVQTLEAVALARLSLCYSARDKHREAVDVTRLSVGLTRSISDPFVHAMSYFLHSRALRYVGEEEKALAMVSASKAMSPIIAFCRQPSQEHCGFLRELLEMNANFDIQDQHGYSPLDYVTSNEHIDARNIVMQALKRNLLNTGAHADVNLEIERRRSEAILRMTYREMFQDKIRPVLTACSASVRDIRVAYDRAVDPEKGKTITFDRLKYVRYAELMRFGRFPRSSDGVVEEYSVKSTVQHVVFISYRWTTRDPWGKAPDDNERRLYHKTMAAIQGFLDSHPGMDADNLGIWIDVCCIDQDNPLQGIASLPLVVPQCDALISLVDEGYHDRAWCSIEVMIIHALRQAYGIHEWFQHVEQAKDSSDAQQAANYHLREGPACAEGDLSSKKLRCQHDMERVLFLERQIRLLC